MCSTIPSLCGGGSSFYEYFRNSSSSTFRLKPPGLFPSELMWNYGSYRQTVGLPLREINPVARPLRAQDDTNTEETR
jgi:hypothetical protein